MEYRKELLRRQLYQSDIFNINTGYYKKEKILPITPKPTEINKKVKEFIPHYKNIYAHLRLNNDLLSQRLNKSYSQNNFNFTLKRQNSEVHNLRKYNKTIKDNCFDENGNFSAKKRFRLEFYGKEERNNIFHNRTFIKKPSKSIKEKRKFSLRKNSKSSLHKLDNVDDLKYKSFKRIHSCKNFCKNKNSTDNDKDIDNKYKKMLEYTPYKQKENKKINGNFPNKDNKQKSINNKFSFTQLSTKKNKNKSLTKDSLNIKAITNKINTKKTTTNNQNFENDDFFIEITNENNNTKKSNVIVDKKKLKQIFLKNGLHIYNFNENATNILSNNEKFEAKLRKNKEDENFDKNYRNVVRELNKINIKVNRHGMVYDSCIFNKNSKIRKGTPGKNLKKNNNKLNYGIKRDKYVLPIQNKEYKNGYKYNLNYFNHNKLDIK